MFSQMKQVYDKIRAEFKSSASNSGVMSEVTDQQFNFLRSMRDQVIKSHLADLYEEDELTGMEINIVQSVFEAVLARAYHLAGCVQYSNLVIVELLELQNITQSIELVQVSGNPCKVGYTVKLNNHLLPRYYTNHNVVIWGRNKSGSIEDISTFKGICDPWRNGLLLEYSEARMPSSIDFTDGYFQLSRIQLLFRIERNMATEEWVNVAGALLSLKQCISANFTTFCKKNNYEFNPAELLAIENAFDSKIKLYNMFGMAKTREEKMPVSTLRVHSLYSVEPRSDTNTRSVMVESSHTDARALKRSSCMSLSLRR